MGGISNTTTEADLHKLFSEYGNVRATKIISDRGGASKGYGFVTFETEEEAKKLQDEVSGQIGSQTQLTGTPISWSACAPLSSAAHNFMPPQSAPSGINRNATALKKYLYFPCPAVTSRHLSSIIQCVARFVNELSKSTSNIVLLKAEIDGQAFFSFYPRGGIIQRRSICSQTILCATISHWMAWHSVASSLVLLLLVNRALSLPRHRANNPSNIQNEVGKCGAATGGALGG